MVSKEKQEIQDNLQTLLSRVREETKLDVWATTTDREGYINERPEEMPFEKFLLVQNELKQRNYWETALKNYDVLISSVIELRPKMEKIIEQICQEIDKLDLINQRESLEKETRKRRFVDESNETPELESVDSEEQIEETSEIEESNEPVEKEEIDVVVSEEESDPEEVAFRAVTGD